MKTSKRDWVRSHWTVARRSLVLVNRRAGNTIAIGFQIHLHLVRTMKMGCIMLPFS